VYDITGRLIRILLEGETQPHESGVSWDGRDDSGEALPSGIYFLRLEEEGEGSASKKVVLLE
jgi:flagellar hook assembly protein FlgD